MFKSPIPVVFRSLFLSVCVATLLIGVTLRNHGATYASGTSARYAFIVFLDGGHPELYNSTNAPFLKSLAAKGTTYTNAQAQVPADSITNIMGAMTGTDATHHGFP